MHSDPEQSALRDILRQIDLAQNFAQGQDRDAFSADIMRVYAVTIGDSRMEVSDFARAFQHVGSAAFGLSLLAWLCAVGIARTKHRLRGVQISREDLTKDRIVIYAEFVAISAFCVSITLFYTSEIVLDIKQDDSNVLKIISNPFFIPVACVAAVGFYSIRCRVPKLYGLTEISIGIFSISLASASSISLASASQGPKVDSIGKILAILGGVYIIVRGLDNINTALKDGPDGPFRTIWYQLFHGKLPPSADASPLAGHPAQSHANPKARAS
jgi:hypothetical protein